MKRFCAESEKLKPRGITLDFSGEAQLISETQSHTFEIEEQPQSEKTATADEVKTFFQKSIYSHPQKERELAKALKYQLESLDKEIERLKSKLGYSELQALQEWKRKAIGSANKKIALVKE